MEQTTNLPEWLKDKNTTDSSLQNQCRRLPQTEAGKALLTRFSQRTNQKTGEIEIYDEEQAALKCKLQYTLSENTIKLITGENQDKCFPTLHYKPTAPTIPTMKDAFGEKMVDELFVNHIMLINAYCGCSTKLDKFQVLLLSTVLKDKFSEGRNMLNAREIMLFFFKVIKGDYGRFYGSVDPMVLGDMASRFLEWRNEQVDRLDRIDQSKQRNINMLKMFSEAANAPEELIQLIHKPMFNKTK